MVALKYIDGILNKVHDGNGEKGFCRMEEVETRIKYF
jgi:hypothetical protein